MRGYDGSIIPRGLRVIRDQGWSAFAKRSRTYVNERLLGRTRMHFFRRRFIKALDEASSLDEVADVLYSCRCLGLTMEPFQQREEILGLMRFVEGMHPRVILEIGTGFGGTLLLFTRTATDDAKIVSLDLPPRMLNISCPKWREPVLNQAAGDSQDVTVLRGNSHDDSTIARVTQCLGDLRIDVLFIDGDHSYEGAKKDFEMYSPLVRAGGVVCFHDIVPHHERSDIGVPRLWSELKTIYRHEEFSVETLRNGIGLVYMDP